jgi:hypothetical protein
MKMTLCDICNKETKMFEGYRYFLKTQTRYFDGCWSHPMDICDDCISRIKKEARSK